MTNVGSVISSAPPSYTSIAGEAFELDKQLRQNAKYVFDRTFRSVSSFQKFWLPLFRMTGLVNV